MENETFRLYYEESGEGEPLILLHGNGENRMIFKAQRAYFEARYRVIAVDTRGHGRSPRGTGPFTLDRFAEDLKNLLDQMGLTKIHLLGFSDGANIAMLFAIRYPEYLKSLILNGGNTCPSGVKLTIQIPIVMGYGLVSLIALADKKAIARKERLALMVKEPHISEEELSKIQAPTLVIAGTKDMIRQKETERIHRCIPESRLSILPGSHFLVTEQPEAFNRTVEEFLKETGTMETRTKETEQRFV